MLRDLKTSSPGSEGAAACPVCTLQPYCLPWDLEADDLGHLERIVEQPATLSPGGHLFRFGDPLRAIHVVRSGAFKIYRTDTWGRERVLGFALPGELVGIDGIYPQRHVSHAVALQESAVCGLPYRELASRMEERPGLRRQIFRLVSRETGHNVMPARNSSADARVAGFLLEWARRRERQGPAADLDLPMSRQDMGNYLYTTADAVERVLERFAARELIRLDGKTVRLLHRGELGRIAGGH